jgi:phosphoribosyl-ATP pyrophosphohydrolase/phosphoribosyl-AMP cyclohydrolase
MNGPPPIAWGADGLVPVAIVDDRTEALLTLAYANREALERTLSSRSTWLFSRSRNALWHKGETSGHTQRVVAVGLDCDADTLVYRVIPAGPACHTGRDSCFEPFVTFTDAVPATAPAPAVAPRDVAVAPGDVAGAAAATGNADGGARFAAALSDLARTIAERKRTAPAGSYTAKLFAGGVDRIGKKIGEEATEVVIAAKNADRGELIWETADLLYHTLVLLAEREISLEEVGAELTRRATSTG